MFQNSGSGFQEKALKYQLQCASLIKPLLVFSLLVFHWSKSNGQSLSHCGKELHKCMNTRTGALVGHQNSSYRFQEEILFSV